MGIEVELKRVIPRPEEVLTPREAALLQRAERGELLCLRCDQPLAAVKIVSDGYEGVTLFCPASDCGFVER